MPQSCNVAIGQEAVFNDIKTNLLEDRFIERVDKIFIKHCRLIDSDLLLARAAFNNLRLPKIPERRNIIIQNDHLFAVERWRIRWKKNIEMDNSF